MEGAPGTLYEGEKFQLLFKFSSRYPFDSPQVCLGCFMLQTCFGSVHYAYICPLLLLISASRFTETEL